MGAIGADAVDDEADRERRQHAGRRGEEGQHEEGGEQLGAARHRGERRPGRRRDAGARCARRLAVPHRPPPGASLSVARAARRDAPVLMRLC